MSVIGDSFVDMIHTEPDVSNDTLNFSMLMCFQ